jgi:hypothetical protein
LDFGAGRFEARCHSLADIRDALSQVEAAPRRNVSRQTIATILPVTH